MTESPRRRRMRERGEDRAPTTAPAMAAPDGQPLGQTSTARHVATGVSPHPLAGWQAQVLAGIPDALIVTDVESSILDWNPAAERIFGYTRAEMLGQTMARVRVPEDTRALTQIMLGAMERDGSWSGTIPFARKDGTRGICETTVSPLRDERGQIAGAFGVCHDVSARTQAEVAAAHLAAIVTSAEDAIVSKTLDGIIVSWNASAERMFGYTADEIIGQSILRLIPPERHAEEDYIIARIRAGERVEHFETVRVAKDGRHLEVSLTISPIRDSAGTIIGASKIARDITARKRMEEDLRQSEQRLRAVLDVLPVGVALVDAAGRPVLVNDAVRQIWGQNLYMAEGQEQYGSYKAWRAATGEPVAGDKWGLARALAWGEVTSGDEYDIETFDGQRKAILDSAAPIRDKHGAIAGAVSVVVDITERRQLEQRTREALEAFVAITQALVEAPDATADVQGDEPSERMERPATFSPLARRMVELTRSILGCSRVAVTSVEEVDGRLYDWPVAIVGMTPELERHWWEVELAARPRELGVGMVPEDRERLLSGEVLTIDLTRPPYQLPNEYGISSLLAVAMRTQGRVVGLLALDFEDVGGQPHVFTREQIQIAEAAARLGAIVLERDRLLRERAEAQARELVAVEAARRMDEFLSIVSHELRTPLTTIKVNLQMAARRTAQVAEKWPGEPPAQMRQLAQLVASAVGATERQERLVLDLLDVSRITSGKLEYRREPMDLAALVREVVAEQRLAEPTRGLSVSVPRTPVTVYGDADRLRQVLANYLTNALKYSPPDRPVAVTLRRLGGSPAERQDGQRVRVEVRDEGPGLTPEQRRHLFERFHRVRGIEVQSGSGIGLGLGLYISKAIVGQHDGEVGVESVPGEGSTFWFTLPLLTADTAGLPHPNELDASQDGPLLDSQGEK